jgi:hypothetical protein
LPMQNLLHAQSKPNFCTIFLSFNYVLQQNKKLKTSQCSTRLPLLPL